MSDRQAYLLLFTALLTLMAQAGEKTIVSLRNFHDVELKSAGIDVPASTTFHIKALGGGRGNGWTYSGDEMSACGWIINAETRELVWRMDMKNTHRSKDDRSFDDKVTLNRGSYEIYFAAPIFSYSTFFTHITTNVDHRQHPLFGSQGKTNRFLEGWFSDDVTAEWEKRSKNWGIDVMVDGGIGGLIKKFPAPKEAANVLCKVVGVRDNVLVRRGFALSDPARLNIYALGERTSELVDGGWIVNANTRARVWEMRGAGLRAAGGAEKNVVWSGDLSLDKGEYVLYYFSDDSHSAADWNALPPYDPLNYGIAISGTSSNDEKKFKEFPYQEDKNVIAQITRVRDNESRTEGFTLKQECRVRVYAIGERSSSRRLMADYGLIMDAKTREKIWTMDVDRSCHAGGAMKNLCVDEVITLPRGSYLVVYNTDDSHAFDDWNADPPFDPEHYGITVMGVGEQFHPSIVTQYVERRDRNIIAQIIRVGDDADKVERFRLDRTTRVRIYAIGEGQNREMYDYGWIEDSKTGTTVWEMTYGTTFHAGGHRKNRMVNSTILLQKGEYKLHYVSDDSHSYGDWNVDPPEDQQYWGITLYREEEGATVPRPPE